VSLKTPSIYATILKCQMTGQSPKSVILIDYFD